MILVIEDNPDSSHLIITLYKLFNYPTFLAKDGTTALEWLKHHIPLLILSDISLPDYNGLDLVKIIKSDQRLNHIPIIAVTAHDKYRFESEENLRFISHFLHKPFSPDDLITLTEKVLNERN